MANQMYGKARESFLNGEISWSSDTFKLLGVTAASYTLSINVDDFLNDISGGAIVFTSSALASKTKTLGVANAATVTVTSVSGGQVDYIILFKDSGSSATSNLIIIWDTATGLPLTPNGGDVTIQFDTGSNKIFVL